MLRYYYQGGVTSHRTESNYTLTMFYLAQAYTKLGIKDFAAKYCGLTMKRQFETGSFELKEFCVNCINLAEYYMNIKNFKQALYVLMAGNSIIPEGKKKKLRATMAMQLAQLMNEYLKTSVAIIVKKENDKSLSTLFNKYSL